jgi:hypothetical protein
MDVELVEPWAGDENFNAVNRVINKHNILITNLGAEVGVRHGIFSEYLLRKNPALSMFLVDPYASYQDVHKEYTEEDQMVIKEEAAIRLAPYDKRAQWLYYSSVMASQYIENSSLDFVFIDANHVYEEVKKDLAAWWPKIRANGLFCGHDFNMDGVNRAVREFATEPSRCIHHISHPVDVWYIFMKSPNE